MASSRARRLLAGGLLFAAAIASLALVADAGAHPRPPLVRQLSAPIERAHTFELSHRVTHLAVHWHGVPTARVRVALSRDGRHFGAPRRVALDDLGRKLRGNETYGAVMLARRAIAVRVYTDRPLRRLSLLAITDRGGPPRLRASATAASISQPKVIPRVDWGADESLRFDSTGKEIWPSAFYPVQKLIVHHTATQNNDPNPAATIRSIYYYHAVTLGWGDIGYNFLIDEAGNVYEGRHTFDYPSGSSPTEENSQGYGVTAAHTQGYNSGTVGIALLGTLTNQDATPAARSALEKLLAWESDHHGIDPQGSSLYVNPVSGTQATFPNIAGHRDLAATECPGGVFYATLPNIRSDVAAMIGGTPPAPTAPAVVTGAASNVTGTSATVSGSVNPNGQQTSYYFQYGTSTAYGGATASTSAGAGSTALPVSAGISGLQRRTTYHYRLVATNASGASYGGDQTFRTSRR
jgi:N-acetylmuramoyl-L-alanine amidase